MIRSQRTPAATALSGEAIAWTAPKRGSSRGTALTWAALWAGRPAARTIVVTKVRARRVWKRGIRGNSERDDIWGLLSRSHGENEWRRGGWRAQKRKTKARSLTLVLVGPLSRRSPRRSKKL